MFELPKLEYDFGAMKNWISATTMEAHHDHHHATYVEKLNAAVETLPAKLCEKYFDKNENENSAKLKQLEKMLIDIREEKLANEIDAKTQIALINHGGGHLNHSLFWETLTPKSDGEPNGKLAQNLNEKYGSFQNFVDEFENAATGVFGSGWAWLNVDLNIETSANQNLAENDVLFGLDVWEHAYYLDYKWARADYVKSWWNHVNWHFAEEKFAKFADN